MLDFFLFIIRLSLNFATWWWFKKFWNKFFIHFIENFVVKCDEYMVQLWKKKDLNISFSSLIWFYSLHWTRNLFNSAQDRRLRPYSTGITATKGWRINPVRTPFPWGKRCKWSPSKYSYLWLHKLLLLHDEIAWFTFKPRHNAKFPSILKQ